MFFHSDENKTKFYKAGFAFGLDLKLRAFRTWKWPVGKVTAGRYMLLRKNNSPWSISKHAK